MSHTRNLGVFQTAALAIVAGVVAGWLGAHLASRPAGDPLSRRDAMDDIVALKRLRMGYIVFPPAVSNGPSAGNPTGHMIDAARYIAAEMNVEVSFQEATWATFAAGLQAKQYDVVVAPLFATPSRAMALNFTEPLYYLGMAMIAKRDDMRFTSLGDLNNPAVQIAVNQGGANQLFVKRYCPKAKRTELAADISQVLSEVIAGRADAAVADTWSVTKFVQQNKGTVQVLFSGRPLDVTAISWAVRPADTRLLKFLNTSIQYLDTTGRMKELEEKYDAHWLHLKREWESN
jgi:polar amino acid transport system substrate-binding protein